MSAEVKAKWTFKRSDGRQLVFGDETFPILKMSGIGNIKPEVFSVKRARGNGNIVTGKRMPPRDVSVTAELFDYTLNPQMFRKLSSFFSYRYTYDVEIAYLNEPRYLASCELTDFDCPTGNVYVPLKPKVSMLAPDGYFLSVDSFGKNLASVRDFTAFPYINEVDKVRPFSYYEFRQKVTLYNDGDDDTFCTVKMVFVGECKNPSVQIGDVYVKVIDEFVENDILIIDSRKRIVTKNGEKIDTKLERGSKLRFFMLGVGDNIIEFSAEEGSQNLDVFVYFNKHYLGV